MSLGGGGPGLNGETCATTTDGLRAAVCTAAAAGITMVGVVLVPQAGGLVWSA